MGALHIIKLVETFFDRFKKDNSSVISNSLFMSNLCCLHFRPPMYWSFPSRHVQGYINELDHFIQVVKGECHISVSRQMTCGVSKIAEAAEESARKGRPVPIAWKPDEVPNGYIMNT